MPPSASPLRWLRRYWQPARGTRRPSRPRHPRRASCRPRLEALEDRLPPTVTFSLGPPVPTPPGTMLFTVTRSGDLWPTVQVNYATVDGSGPSAAHAGTDYTATSGTLLFPPGQTTQTVNVPVVNSAVFQTPLTFGVALSGPMATALFAQPQVFGPMPNPRAVADFNGDAKTDLVTLNRGDCTLLVLLNTTAPGATTVSFAPQPLLAGQPSPGFLTLGDVNGDGNPDLVTGEGPTAVGVWLNTGSLTFTLESAPAPVVPSAPTPTPTPAPAPSAVYVNPAFTGPAGTDPDGAGPATALGYDAFPTIQQGLNAVAPSGIVHVAAGTYAEDLVINHSVTLQGAVPAANGSGMTILAGNGAGVGLNVTTANGVAIDRLAVKGYYASLTLDGGDGFDTVNVFDQPGLSPYAGSGTLQALPDGTLEFDVSYPLESVIRVHFQNVEQVQSNLPASS